MGCIAQGILAAVLSAVVGTRDPEQVNSMAKQAGEVCNYHQTFVFSHKFYHLMLSSMHFVIILLYIFFNIKISVSKTNGLKL